MTDDVMTAVPAHIEVDPSPVTGQVLLIAFGKDEDLDSMVLRLTPAMAARLGQRLISVANRMQP